MNEDHGSDDDDASSSEEDGSESEDDPFDEPHRIEYGREALIRAMCFTKAAGRLEQFVLDALNGPRDGKELDIPLLSKQVESIRTMRISSNELLEAAVARTTSILGRERFESEVQGVANELLGDICPGIATPEEVETRSSGKKPTDSRRRRASKRPPESPPSTPSPPSKRKHPRKRTPPAPATPAFSSPQPQQKGAAAATKKPDSAASKPRPGDPTTRTVLPRGQPNGLATAQGRPADEGDLDAATPSPAAVSASAAAASTVNVREETSLISKTRFEGRVLVFGTSLWHLADAKLVSILDSDNFELGELSELTRTVFRCLSGGFNSTVLMRSSLEAEQSEIEHIVAFNEGTRLKDVLRCMEKSSKSDESILAEECERLQYLRGLIYSLQNGGKEGKASNAALRKFLLHRAPARNRISAFAYLGVTHVILSYPASQIVHGLKHEGECIGSLEVLSCRLNPDVPFDANVSVWRALNDILMPTLKGQDEVVTLTLNVEGEYEREVSKHRLAAKVICMLIDSLGLTRGREISFTAHRQQYLFGENGPWAQADSATVCQSVGTSTAEQVGSSGEGYFLQTETDENGRVKDETVTHRDRRKRLMALLKALLLRGAISAREPNWDFVGDDFMCNLLSLSATDHMNCLRHITKEYFCGEWTSKVQKAAKQNRATIDKKIAKASSRYAEDVKQNVVIENEQQLNSLKRLYN